MHAATIFIHNGAPKALVGCLGVFVEIGLVGFHLALVGPHDQLAGPQAAKVGEIAWAAAIAA